MTKHGMRAFSLGICLAALTLGATYYFERNDQDRRQQSPTIREEQVNAYLEERQLTAIEKTRLEQLENAAYRTDEQNDNNAREGKPEKEVVYQAYISVQSGMTFNDVANYLEAANIINDQQSFLDALEEGNLLESLQIGNYTLDSSMGIKEIINIMS